MNSTEEKIIQLLSDHTNRAVLSILNDAAQDLSVDELADRILRQEISSGASCDTNSEQLVLRLHHDHLPRLDEAGLVEYDHESNDVAYGEYTGIDAEWREIEAFDELLGRFKTSEGVGDSTIGLLEGRDAVYDYCRELADTADNELFLIYSSEELLDEDCLPHATNAIERGVNLHAGAKSQMAREFFRESLPEATIWEPQMDWMYHEAGTPKISRMAFADRETVVVGLWLADDQTKREVAMIGDGPTNPLVILVRELLGARLDHLDYQSDDFLDQLPFSHDR